MKLLEWCKVIFDFLINALNNIYHLYHIIFVLIKQMPRFSTYTSDYTNP